MSVDTPEKAADGDGSPERRNDTCDVDALSAGRLASGDDPVDLAHSERTEFVRDVEGRVRGDGMNHDVIPPLS